MAKGKAKAAETESVAENPINEIADAYLAEVTEPAPVVEQAAPKVEIQSKVKTFLESQGATVRRSTEFPNVLCVAYGLQRFDMNEQEELGNIRLMLTSRGFDENAVANM